MLSPNIDTDILDKGQTLRLNEALTIVEACEFDSVGEISTPREVLADGKRALVVGHVADEERVVWLAEPLVGSMEGDVDGPGRKPRPGDSLLVDTKAGFAFERVPKAEGRGPGPRRGSRRGLRGHRWSRPADRADP